MAAFANRVKVQVEWIDAEVFDSEDPSAALEPYHAILVPGGFGERGTEGKIRAATYAREKKNPLFSAFVWACRWPASRPRATLRASKMAGSEEFDH